MTSPQKCDYLTPPFFTICHRPNLPPPPYHRTNVTNYFDEIVQESCQKIDVKRVVKKVFPPLIHLTLAQSPDLLILIKNSSRQELGRSWQNRQELKTSTPIDIFAIRIYFRGRPFVDHLCPFYRKILRH